MPPSAITDDGVPEVPLDEEGFCVTFPADDVSGVQRFLSEYGFVVIRNALTQDHIDRTLDEFWRSDDLLRRDDPKTWEPFWEDQRFGWAGIIGWGPDLRSLAQLENRQSRGVYEAFSSVLQSRKLWIEHDRLGVMRPTVAVDTGDGPADRPEWRTKKNWLHLDCNPVSRDDDGVGLASIGGFSDNGDPIDFRETLIIQGLLTLTDAREADGGFHCVPGSHKRCIEWARANQKHASSGNIQVPAADPLHQQVKRVPLRRGCLLAWTSLLFHGNHPNHSENFRAVQYIRAMPTTQTPYGPLCPERRHYPEEFEPTELGQKLFGLTKWD